MVSIPWLVLRETEAQRREAACSGVEVGRWVLLVLVLQGWSGSVFWVRLSKIKGWHSGTDYFSPFPMVPAWPLHAPRVPQQMCWEAWSKAGIAIPTVHPLPGLLGRQGAEGCRPELGTCVSPPQSHWVLLFLLSSLLTLMPVYLLAFAISSLLSASLPCRTQPAALILQHQFCLLPAEEQIQ